VSFESLTPRRMLGTEPEKIVEVCNLCDRPRRAMGLCWMHLRRLKRHNNVHHGEAPLLCICCKDKHKAIGLCNSCYMAFKRGSMEMDKFVKLRRKEMQKVRWKRVLI
jgi:hypothetical protein